MKLYNAGSEWTSFPLLRAAVDLLRPWTLAALAILIVWVLAALVIDNLRSTAIQNWSRAAANTSRTGAMVVDRSVTGGNLLLASMADWVLEQGIDTEEQWLRLDSTPDLTEKLRRRLVAAPDIAGIALIARDGRLVVSTRSYPPSPLNLADRDFFREQIAAVAPPVSAGATFSKITGEWLLFVARRITAADGSVLGVVVLGFDAARIREVFRSQRAEPGTMVSLVRHDGTILASSVGPESAIKPTCATKLLGVTDIAGPLIRDAGDCFEPGRNGRMIVATRRLESLPFFVLTTIPDTVYAGYWWVSWGRVTAVAAVLSVLIVVVAVTMMRLRANREVLSRVDAEREILARVFEAPLGVAAIIEEGGKVRYSNPGFRALVGGALVDDNLLRSPGVDGTAELQAILADALASPHELDLRIERVGAPPRILRITASRTIMADGRLCAVLYGFDETERRMADMMLVQSAKMITLGEMATGMAHELNQPLNVIKMATQVARLETGADAPPPFVAEQLARIEGQVDRASSLINLMRIFGREPTDPAGVVDIREACHNVDKLIGESVRTSGTELTFDIGSMALPVCGQLILVEQLVLNLILNARDAVKSAGTANAKIRVIAAAAGDAGIYLRVCDNGPGVPEAIRDRLFEPFFTTKAIGQGTGLGLSIAFGIVRDAGGKISCRPSDVGATFEIELPLATSECAKLMPAGSK